MKFKKYRQFQTFTLLFIVVVIIVSLVLNLYFLAAIGFFTGLLFLLLIHSWTRATVDEREQTIREKAANTAYAIFAPTLGLGTFLLFVPSFSGLSVFTKGEFIYLESLGVIFAYLTLSLIILYALSYFFFNQKFGGGSNNEK